MQNYHKENWPHKMYPSDVKDGKYPFTVTYTVARSTHKPIFNSMNNKIANLPVESQKSLSKCEHFECSTLIELQIEMQTCWFSLFVSM